IPRTKATSKNVSCAIDSKITPRSPRRSTSIKSAAGLGDARRAARITHSHARVRGFMLSIPLDLYAQRLSHLRSSTSWGRFLQEKNGLSSRAVQDLLTFLLLGVDLRETLRV